MTNGEASRTCSKPAAGQEFPMPQRTLRQIGKDASEYDEAPVVQRENPRVVQENPSLVMFFANWRDDYVVLFSCQATEWQARNASAVQCLMNGKGTQPWLQTKVPRVGMEFVAMFEDPFWSILWVLVNGLCRVLLKYHGISHWICWLILEICPSQVQRCDWEKQAAYHHIKIAVEPRQSKPTLPFSTVNAKERWREKNLP